MENLQLFQILAHKSDILDSIILFLATDFGLIVAFAFLYYLYTHKDKREGGKELMMILFSALIAWGVSQLINLGYPVARPFIAFPEMTPLFQHGTGFDSFPSGHATFFSALAGAILPYHKKIAVLVFLVAIIVGLARVASGVHFFTDVIAGWVLGAGIAYAISYYWKQIN